MTRPAVYFTTNPRACTCSVENDFDGLNIQPDGLHYDRCPARCWAVTTVNRFGVAGVTPGVRWSKVNPTRRLQCVAEHDHDGDHHAQSPLGGHHTWWTDAETRHFEGGARS